MAWHLNLSPTFPSLFCYRAVSDVAPLRNLPVPPWPAQRCWAYLEKANEALQKYVKALDFFINYVPQQLPSGVREWYLRAAAAKLREL